MVEYVQILLVTAWIRNRTKDTEKRKKNIKGLMEKFREGYGEKETELINYGEKGMKEQKNA